MSAVLAAEAWHYWLALPLVIGSVLLVVALFAGYLRAVVRPKYPPRKGT